MTPGVSRMTQDRITQESIDWHLSEPELRDTRSNFDLENQYWQELWDLDRTDSLLGKTAAEIMATWPDYSGEVKPV